MPRGYRDDQRHARHVSLRRSAPRILTAILGLLTLSVAACSSDSGGQAALAKNQVFVFPYANSNAVAIGGVENKSHDAVLDPAALSLAADTNTASMLYSGLVTYGPNLKVVPDAATSWDVSSDGKVYTFHLRPNMHFSDGAPLTAADYAYSIDRALDPTLCTTLDATTYGPHSVGHQSSAFCSPVAQAYLNYILGADGRIGGSGGSDHSLIGQGDDPNHGLDVIDAQTLKIRLSQPIAYFIEALTYPTSYPVEKSLVDKYPGGLWVDHLNEGGCSGPFQVKSYSGGQQLVLVPNRYWEDAWGKKLTLTEVDRPLVASSDVEYKNYRAQDPTSATAYGYTEIPTVDYQTAQSQDGFNEAPVLSLEYVGFNVDKPPFNNVQIRQAFDLALNKQILVDTYTHGGYYPTNHIVPRGMPGFDTNLLTPGDPATQSLTGDQAQALKLLKQVQDACTADGNTDNWCPYVSASSPQEIDVWYNSSNVTRAAIIPAAADNWNKALSLNVHAKGFSGSGYYGPIEFGAYQAYAAGWVADYPDPQDWLSLQFHGGSAYIGTNLAAYNDPARETNSDGSFKTDPIAGNILYGDYTESALDHQMDTADQNTDQTSRMQQYNAIEQQIVDDSPWIPYAQGKGIWLQRSWVHGFALNALLIMPDISWPSVYITDHSGS